MVLKRYSSGLTVESSKLTIIETLPKLVVPKTNVTLFPSTTALELEDVSVKFLNCALSGNNSTLKNITVSISISGRSVLVFGAGNVNSGEVTVTDVTLM